MVGVVVRQVTAEDVPACATIEAACFPSEEAASLERIARRAEVFAQGFLVAVLGGEVVGFINSGSTGADDLSDEELKDMVGHDPGGSNLVVFSLATRPDCRGMGIGGRLLDELVRRAGPMGKQCVLLLCKQELVGYYARSGFREEGASASTHGGARWRQMRLHVSDGPGPNSDS